MKRSLKTFMKSPMLVVFILILLVFTPFAIFNPGENRNRAVVLAVGIDKVDNEYEVSLLTFIPTANSTYKQTTSVVSGKGVSVADAIYDAQFTLGRQVGLSHAKTTVVSEKLLKEDISSAVDYLSRVASLPENTILICTNDSAKNLLKSSQTLEYNVGLKLDQLLAFNADKVYVTDTTLEAFYKGYYSSVKSSIIGFLSLEPMSSQVGGAENTEQSAQGGSSGAGGQGGSESSGGGSESSGGDSGGSSDGAPSSEGDSGGSGGGSSLNQLSSTESSSSDNSQKQILNKGETVLLKDGKLAAKIDARILDGINLINKSAIGQTIYLNDVKDDFYDGVDLTYTIRNKKVLTSTKFQNGYPIFSINVIIGMELVEINADEGKAMKVNTEFSKITPTVKRMAEKELITLFSDALKVLRENKTDIIGVTKYFQKSNRKEFEKFLNSIEDPDDFLRYVTFQLVPKIQSD